MFHTKVLIFKVKFKSKLMYLSKGYKDKWLRKEIN